MSGYSWFRFDCDAGRHPKFSRLDDVLEERNTLAYAARAWSWLMTYAARGVWAPELDGALEDACDWRGARGVLVAAFMKVGLVEETDDGGREWHDWWEKQGKAVEKAERDARVKRENRLAKKAAKEAADGGAAQKKRAKAARAARADGAQTAPLRDVTGRDETEQSSSYEDDGPASSSPGVQFFDWFQTQRSRAGLVPERAPSRESLDEFFSAAAQMLEESSAEGTREALEVAAGFLRDGGYWKDPHWAGSLPWAGFVAQWARHVRSGQIMRKAEQRTMPLGVLGAVG